MGKITPGFKTILVFITFLGFTNFILSETKINFSEIVLNGISESKDLVNDNLGSADPASLETRGKKHITNLLETKSSKAPSVAPVVSISTITPSSCQENNDGAIVISVSGGETPYIYEWTNGQGYSSSSQNIENIPAGTYQVKVTDNSNISTTVSGIEVSVEDKIIPQISAPAAVLVNTTTGSCTATGVSLGTPVTSDNCTNFTVENDAPTSYPIGNTTVIWTITDASGNKAIAEQIITVTDIEKPVITHNGNQNVNSDSATCGASVTVSATATDNCSVGNPTGTRSDSQALNTAFPVGTTTVTWIVTDANGNEATPVTQTVVVTDNEKPVITHNGNQNVNSDSATCGASVTVSATATDNCSVGNPTGTRSDSQALNTAFPVGTTTVTWIVTDANGNEATPVTQTVVVTDNEKPVITHNGNQNVNSDSGICGAAVIVSATATDNCSVGNPIGTRSDAQALNAAFPVGTTTITWNVTDANGNEATPVIQTIVVTDTEKPVITHNGDQNINNEPGTCRAAVTVSATANDNCSVGNPTGTRSDGLVLTSPYPVGTTTITWNVTDVNGNQAIPVIQTIVVIDSEKPVITHNGDQNFGNDPDTCGAFVTTNASAIDNCSVGNPTGTRSDALSLTEAYPVGTTTITWNVTDVNGNEAAPVIQTIIVRDTQPPVTPALPDLTAECPLTVTPPTTTDNCGGEITGTTGVTELVFKESGSIFWIFTDASGNASAPVEQKIIISDTQAPVADVQILPKKTITGCQISDISELDIPTATDSCEGIIYGTLGDDFQFPYLFYGTRMIEWKFVDSNGNSSIQTQEIELIEANINGGTLSGTYLNTVFSSIIDITSCEESMTVDLKLSGQIGPIIQWEKLAVNEGIWKTISNTTDSHQVYFAAGALESTYYRALIKVGTCIKYSTTFYIRALPPGEPPTVTNVDGDDMKYCLGDQVNLVAKSNYLVTEDAMPNSSGDFDQGQLNTQDPNGWLVDDKPGDFTAGGNARKARNWSGTNDHDFGGIKYDSRDKKFTIAYGNYYELDSRGKPVYVDKIPTTLESPIMDLSNAESASLDFDQAFNFATNDLAIIEISIDGGKTYQALRVMHAQGGPATTWYTAGTAESLVGSTSTQYFFNTDNTSISLAAYLGQSQVRIRWSFIGTTDKSVWAMDNIKINKKIFVETELEWTEGIGNPAEEPIATGSTEVPISFIPDTPGVHEYGGTALVNSCRTYSEEGTGLIIIPVTSSYAGEDIIYTSAECGRNIVQLNAYDNTKTANENITKGAFSTPASGCRKCDAPGTGDIGTWSWTGATPSCTEVSFSNINDPDATFTAGPGTYTLTWTVNGCSNNMVVTITDCDKVDFDGTDDYVDFNNNYNLNGAFSIEVWVKPGSVNGIQTIFSKREAGNSTTNGYDLRITDGIVSFNWDNSGILSSAPHVINTNRWYHIALTHSAGGEYRLYIDGIFIKLAGGGSPGTNVNSAILGAMDSTADGLPKNHYNGWMEELRIWGVALNPEQIRLMMNQRVKKGDDNKVIGEVIPLNIPALAWSNLIGYYRMDDVGCGNLYPYNDGANYIGYEGKLINITTPQEKTAPLPYISATNGPWRDKNTWTQPVVWDAPNSKGINGDNINWNIAKINHNITSGGHDINLLGLLSVGGTLKMANPNEADDWQNSGHALRISHYLKLDGFINLVGESQLVQTDIRTSAEITDPATQFPQSFTSVLDESSSGYIERAQQGTANSFNYNYWSSPVSLQGAANNSTFTVGQVMLDGSPTTNYGKTLSFHPWHEFADWGYATPRKISSYWLYKFRGTVNVYSEWKHIGDTGVLLAGEGYTMKGTSGQAPIDDRQNYVFKGKPNNGAIRLTVGKDQNYLLGNPYPSAIDVNAFILENLKDVNGGKNTENVFNGAVYFWDHFAGGDTHILLEYVGGYATRNLLGGTPAISNDERINANDAKGSKIPGRFIPVGQGFFINTSLEPEAGANITIHGGDVQFNNSQRSFVRESTGNTGNSLFLQQEKVAKSSESKDTRPKIRLDFKSPKKYNRQILVGVDPNTTTGFDLGYDAALNDNNVEDMYWLINQREYIIQGVPDFNPERVLKLGIKIAMEGEFSIKINDLENVADDVNIYLKDKETSSYFNLRKSEYRLNIAPGNYHERFEIVFQIKTEPVETPPPGEEEEEEEEEAIVDVPGGGTPTPGETINPEIFFLTHSSELVVKNPGLQLITQITLYSMSGQIIENYQNLAIQKETRLPVRNYSSSVYMVKMVTETGIINKKLILNN